MNLKRIPCKPALGASLGLTLLLACGGHGGDKAKATALAYSDPAGPGWLLVKNPASTPTHLVLDLKAPAAGTGLGVGFKLTLDDRQAQWAKVAAGDAQFLANEAYDLGAPVDTQLCRGMVHGGELSAGVYQKGVASPVVYNGTVLSVAIDFKEVEGLEAGAIIPLLVAKANHVAADGATVDIKSQLHVGTLTSK